MVMKRSPCMAALRCVEDRNGSSQAECNKLTLEDPSGAYRSGVMAMEVCIDDCVVIRYFTFWKTTIANILQDSYASAKRPTLPNCQDPMNTEDGCRYASQVRLSRLGFLPGG